MGQPSQPYKQISLYDFSGVEVVDESEEALQAATDVSEIEKAEIQEGDDEQIVEDANAKGKQVKVC